jgi:hypothetical protein
VSAGPGLDPGREEPGDAGARQHAHLDPHPGAEGQHVQPVRAGHKRVGRAGGQVDQAVAGADGVGGRLGELARHRPTRLPAEARAGQHEEDLLLGAVGVRGGRALAGAELDPLDADAAAARRRAEVGPGGRERLQLHAVAGDLVPVDDDGRAHGLTLHALDGIRRGRTGSGAG